MSEIGRKKIHSDDAEIKRLLSCFSLVAAAFNFWEQVTTKRHKTTFFRRMDFNRANFRSYMQSMMENFCESFCIKRFSNEGFCFSKFACLIDNILQA